MGPTAITAELVHAHLIERGVDAARIEMPDAEHPWADIANTEITGQPLVVVRCAGTDDALQAVEAAARHGLPLAVRGGGYSPAGLGTVDGGIVADVSALDHIAIDRDDLVVRVGAGTLTGDLEKALDAHGLAMTLPVPSRAGVVGAALSGGVGVLLRKLGYISDAIIGATVVTPGLGIVRVGDDDESGLLWALKGGGGNFGVVTELEFRCIALRELTTTQLVFGREHLAEAVHFYCSWTASLPDATTAVAMIRSVPPFPGMPPEAVGTVGLMLTVIHSDPQTSEETVASLADAPPAIYTATSTTSPLQLREAMERGFPMARFGAIIRSGWADTLDSADISALVDLALALPSQHSIVEIVRLGGGIPRVARPGCAPGRNEQFLLNAMALWVDPEEAPASRAWAERGTGVLRSVADTAALIPGFTSEDQLHAAPETYADDYSRLRRVKARYDPQNLFRRNLNIQPAT